MAFYTGSANSLADLQSALTAACVAEGWSNLGVGILQLGAAYVQLTVSGNSLRVRGGTGASGGTLTAAAVMYGRLGLPNTAAMVWPVSYQIHIHGNPAEVYLVVNTSVDIYTWLAFGVSSVAGLPGTGTWFAGSWANYSVHTGIDITATSGGGQVSGNNRNQCGALFWQTDYWVNSAVHHNFEGGGWGPEGQDANLLTVVGYSVAVAMMAPQIARSPSAWNGEAVLLPIQAYVLRPSGKRSLVADLAHARYVRLAYYDPGQIVTLGADRWIVFPWYRKDSATPNGGSGLNHTGTFGWAIRYDGP